MSAKKTPGQVLVEALTRALSQQLEFDESELSTLDLISHAAGSAGRGAGTVRCAGG